MQTEKTEAPPDHAECIRRLSRASGQELAKSLLLYVHVAVLSLRVCELRLYTTDGINVSCNRTATVRVPAELVGDGARPLVVCDWCALAYFGKDMDTCLEALPQAPALRAYQALAPSIFGARLVVDIARSLTGALPPCPNSTPGLYDAIQRSSFLNPRRHNELVQALSAPDVELPPACIRCENLGDSVNPRALIRLDAAVEVLKNRYR